MKFVLFLLTAMAATTSALQISGMITGEHDTYIAECPEEQVNIFFNQYVLRVFANYGIPVSRRLQELRGDVNRDLGVSCRGSPTNPPPYSFCWL